MKPPPNLTIFWLASQQIAANATVLIHLHGLDQISTTPSFH
jgi:hypothetical protein